MNHDTFTFCAVCTKQATTNADGVPVCGDHWQEYITEVMKFGDETPFADRLKGTAKHE